MSQKLHLMAMMMSRSSFKQSYEPTDQSQCPASPPSVRSPLFSCAGTPST